MIEVSRFNPLRNAAIFIASMRGVMATAALLVLTATAAIAQPQAPAIEQQDDWKIAIYPIFVWVPLGINIDVEVPPFEGGGGGGAGAIVDGRFDGAYLGGFSAAKGLLRIDGDGLWAGFGGDRAELPFLKVDVDATYFHLTGGAKVVKDLYNHRRSPPAADTTTSTSSSATSEQTGPLP